VPMCEIMASQPIPGFLSDLGSPNSQVGSFIPEGTGMEGRGCRAPHTTRRKFFLTTGFSAHPEALGTGRGKVEITTTSGPECTSHIPGMELMLSNSD
jgi:hypothetical protein